MIGFLRGSVLRKDGRRIFVDVSGVGYVVNVPTPVSDVLRVSEQVAFHIHTHVTDSAITLYGFARAEECAFFELLLSVSGIGAKTALSICSQPMDLVARAIQTDDVATLTKVPGIGRKTAERMIIELKEKVQGMGTGIAAVRQTPLTDEALQALLALGFPRYEAVHMLSNVPADITEPQQVVQYALKQR